MRTIGIPMLELKAEEYNLYRLVFAFSMGYLAFIHAYRWLILSHYYIDVTGPIMQVQSVWLGLIAY